MSKTRPKIQAKSVVNPWPMVRLGDVCEVRAGASYKDVEDPNGRYPIYGTGGIMGRASQYRCPAHSVIVGRKGTLDNPFLVHEPFWNIDTCFGVVPSERIIPEYLFRFCQGFDFYSLVPASGRPSTTSDAVRAIEIPLPSLSAQKEIVARLERELAAVEKMKKGFEALAETAKAEFKAELKEVFEELDGKMDGQVRASEQGHLGWRKLGEVCDVRDGTHDTPAKCDNGCLLLTSKNIRKGKVDKTNAYYISASDYAAINKRSGVDQWDVLFSMIGTVGETAIVDEPPDFAIKNMGLFKTHADELLARWIKYYFDSPVAKQLIFDRLKGSNQKFLSLGVLRVFPLALTDRDSMLRLVTRIDAAKARAEKLEAKAREGVAVCETMRKAILKEAFE